MKLAKIISLFCLFAMTAVLVFAFTRGDFAADGALISANPWGIVSLVDLYAGFILFSIWIVYREQTWWKAVLWVFAMMVLGFWTGALYMYLGLQKSNNNWHAFWLGKHYIQS